jgi:hypothetical protein
MKQKGSYAAKFMKSLKLDLSNLGVIIDLTEPMNANWRAILRKNPNDPRFRRPAGCLDAFDFGDMSQTPGNEATYAKYKANKVTGAMKDNRTDNASACLVSAVRSVAGTRRHELDEKKQTKHWDRDDFIWEALLLSMGTMGQLARQGFGERGALPQARDMGCS